MKFKQNSNIDLAEDIENASINNPSTDADFTLTTEKNSSSASAMHQKDAESDVDNDDSSRANICNTMVVATVTKEWCEKCGQQVSPFEMPEHLDYHLAKELQAQLSREENNQNRRNEALVAKVAAPKNKRKGRPSSAAQKVIIPPDAKKQKTISSFFGKK